MLLFVHSHNSSQQGSHHTAQPRGHLLCMLCCACHALHAMSFVSVVRLNLGRAEDASVLNSLALHAAHAA